MEVQTQNNNIITPFCTPSLQGVKPLTPLKLHEKNSHFLTRQNLNVRISTVNVFAPGWYIRIRWVVLSAPRWIKGRWGE